MYLLKSFNLFRIFSYLYISLSSAYALNISLLNTTELDLHFNCIQTDATIPFEDISHNYRSKPIQIDPDLDLIIECRYNNLVHSKTLIPTSGPLMLIIAYIDLDNRLDYMVMDDSPDAFPLGSYIFLNLTKEHTIGLIDQDKLALKPFEARKISWHKEHQSYFNGKLAYWDDGNKRWINWFSNRWIHRDNVRVLTLIIQKKGKRKRFGIKSIAQYPSSIKSHLEHGNELVIKEKFDETSK